MKKILLGDSMLKTTGFMKGTFIIVKPGKGISFFTDYIKKNALWMSSYDIVIIHAGTNDIQAQGIPEMMLQYQTLAFHFKRSLPNCKLAFSCVIPRPIDEHTTGGKVKEINRGLIRWCTVKGYMCLRTFQPFLHGAKAKVNLFKGGRDQLHLNKEGQRQLDSFLQSQLSDRQIDIRLRQLGSSARRVTE